MTDEQRIAKIDKLLQQISPLNYEKLFLRQVCISQKKLFQKL